MSDLERFTRLKRDVERARKRGERADGALAEVMRRLRDEHGCSTVGEAQAKLASLEEAEQKARARYQRELARFEAKWKSFLRKEGKK